MPAHRAQHNHSNQSGRQGLPVQRNTRTPKAWPHQDRLPPAILPTLAGFALLVLAFFWQSAAMANTPSVTDRYAKACLDEAARLERLYKMPKDLMGAIALTESGRQSKEGPKIAWPWTINVEGKGYRFATKQQAISAVRKHQQAGKTSIDVGCFQVNLKWHPDAFPNLGTAFDPRKSGIYAASFLRSLRKELGGWDRAMRAWHSRERDKGKRYGKMVYANRKLLRQQRRAATRQAATTTPHHLRQAERRRLARSSFLRLAAQQEPGPVGRLCLKKASTLLCLST